jgi:hypothetical protein
MKKLYTITFASLLITSLTSCFLFQTHETCPAYSQIEKKIEKDNLKKEVLNTTIINS